MCCTNPTGYFKSSVALAVAGVLAAAPAAAQDFTLEEIVVTAQKREQSLSDVPLAVSAITGDAVNDYLGGAQDIRALAARVPGLNIETSNGRTQPRFYLRGLGNIDFDVNANQPVAMVFDEIALENNVLRSLPLFDLERIEVLKGPQGSLFGRNTNAGAIKIDSVRPDSETRDAYVRASFGSRETFAVEGASNFSISDSVIARVSVKHQQRGEWIDNVVNGGGDDFGEFEETAWRLQFLFEPSDNFSGLFKLHGFTQSGSDPTIFYANAIEVGSDGLRGGFDEEVARNDNQIHDLDLDHFGAALNLEWSFDNDMSFTSITGYDTVDNFQSADVDGGEISFDVADIGALGRQVFFNVATGDGLTDHYQLTQEFRLAQQRGQLFYQVGLFYLDEDFDLFNRDFLNPDANALVNQQTESLALFGQVEYSINDQFTLTVGGRWTDDEKDLTVAPGPLAVTPTVNPDSISVSDDFFNWDIALTYDMTDTLTWYGRVATGSRGPVTLGRFGFVSSAETEDSTAFEIGFKSDLLNGRARWNSAVYAFQNDDQQLTATGGAANVNQLLNADQVDGYGFETEFDVLITDNLFISANLSYNDTEIDDPNLRDDLCGSAPTCTGLDPVVGTRVGPFGPVTEVSIDGNPLPRTPEWIANFTLEYTYPLNNAEVYFNTDWNYRDESNLFLHRSVEFVQEERLLGGLRTGYRTDAGMDIAIVGRNITDEVTVDGAINFLNLTAFVNEPAYWGLEFRYDF
ncbi:MAG: TonB-dependent receptor [Pseudomonadota bacterium]